MSGGIYTIRFLDDERFYIGKTWNFKKRWQHHLWELQKRRHYNRRLQAIFNATGIDAIRFVIEEVVPDKAERTSREQQWLDKHFGTDQCINFDSTSCSEYTGTHLVKRAAWNKGVPSTRKGVPRTQEEKDAIRRATLGKKKRPRSTPVTDEERRRRSAATRGRRVSEVTRMRISLAQLGKKRGPRPEEVREKISLAHMGKKLTEEHRAALREGHRRRKERLTMHARVAA